MKHISQAVISIYHENPCQSNYSTPCNQVVIDTKRVGGRERKMDEISLGIQFGI